MDLNDLFHRQGVERSCAERATAESARQAHAQLARRFERQIEIATDGRVTFSRARQF